MRTKEEILETKNWSMEYPNFMQESEILDAMDEYAKEVSINYAHWLLGRMFPYTVKGDAPNPEAEKLYETYQQ